MKTTYKNENNWMKVWALSAVIVGASGLFFNFPRISDSFMKAVNPKYSARVDLAVQKGLEARVNEGAQREVVQNISKENLITENLHKTGDFSEKELEIIYNTADRVGVNPALLMAIRKAENGNHGLEFGIIHTKSYENDKGITEDNKLRPYINEFEKQCTWCAWTIKNNLGRYQKSNSNEDFISYLQKRYCPIGAENDLGNLNKNWEKNVRFYHNKYNN